MSTLEDVHQQILACTDCPLHQHRTTAVPGEGSAQAKVMFVGEGPGFQEDVQGRPFIGPAGQFLNELLASVGLRREDVYITNMVKCRPPNNRDPFPGEIDTCNKYLQEQVQLIQPQIIIPLGRHALANWFPGESISKVRAKPRRHGNTTLFPLYHPAAALHNSALRKPIEQDFQAMGALLQAMASPPSDTDKEGADREGAGKEGPPEADGRQLSML